MTARYHPTSGHRDGQSVEPASVAGFTVFLGSSGNFDHWGDPSTGWVWYVGNPEIGCNSGNFGDRLYWRSHRAYRAGTPNGETFTAEGAAW